MLNPMQAWNEWCALSMQAARLGWETQSVIALRLMRLAAQGPGNQTQPCFLSDILLVIFIRWRVAPARRAGSIKSWSRLVADVAAFFLAVTMELGRSGRSMMGSAVLSL